MNRRNYLTTLGASLASTSALSSLSSLDVSEGDADDDDGSNCPPTYYTVSMPSISVQLVHISIPDDLLNRARDLRVYSDERAFFLRSIEGDVPDDRGTWTIRNYVIPDHSVASVTVGGVEGREWDVLEVQRAAMFLPAEDSDDEGFIGVLADDRPVTIETPADEYVYEVGTYTQRRVPTADPSEVDVWTMRGDERVSIPLYPVAEWWFYHHHKQR